MTYAELIQLYFERSNALQWYWTLYVIVIGGLLAFASQRQRADPLTTALVTVLFAFFAFKNMDAIADTSRQRFAALELVKKFAPPPADPLGVAQARAILEPTLNPPELGGVRNFHYASDALTIAALWAMELRRRRAAREAVAAR